jgi:V8-like Glu-specific endopeptidase
LNYLFASFLLFFAATAQAEPRQLYVEDSPAWLAAVGTLTVPGHRFEEGEQLHHRENCSATLIAPQTILTAWHCLEYYRDLSQQIVFSLPYQPQQPSWLARRLADGAGMTADWALLRLERPVKNVVPVAVRSRWQEPSSNHISIAGYSRDAALGAGGDNLTWQAQCMITEDEDYRVATDCEAYKGASGGPVIRENKIVGVISAGDGEGLTYFAPSKAFMSAVRRHRR